MSKRLYLFAIWCLLMILTSIAMSYYAWSPFADGGRGSHVNVYGPSHK